MPRFLSIYYELSFVQSSSACYYYYSGNPNNNNNSWKAQIRKVREYFQLGAATSAELYSILTIKKEEGDVFKIN